MDTVENGQRQAEETPQEAGEAIEQNETLATVAEEPAQADPPPEDTGVVSDPDAVAAAEQFVVEAQEQTGPSAEESEEATLLAVLEAIVYITDEPLSLQQIAGALRQPVDVTQRLLDKLVDEFSKPQHGLNIREIAGGYKMTTKAEHHEAVRQFVKNLNPPLKLSLAALETLAVIAYKQPMTAPEIMEIRGVQGAGVLKTLLDRKLITTAGRKNVIGKPILYKTTKEFLVQFGLKDLSELPSLKEFEELRRLAFSDDTEAPAGLESAAAPEQTEPEQVPDAPGSPVEEAAAQTEPEQLESAAEAETSKSQNE